jgi:hypothetical protein
MSATSMIIPIKMAIHDFIFDNLNVKPKKPLVSELKTLSQSLTMTLLGYCAVLYNGSSDWSQQILRTPGSICSSCAGACSDYKRIPEIRQEGIYNLRPKDCAKSPKEW